jgi:hypothetical protein
VLDVNGALLAALAAAEPFRHAPPVAAVFACDPFLRVADAAAALRRAGIAQVLNWPSVQAHDGEAAAALAAVGYRMEAEFRTLLAFASHGLEPLAFAGEAHCRWTPRWRWGCAASSCPRASDGRSLRATWQWRAAPRSHGPKRPATPAGHAS